jgi:hypothetical protein
MLFEMEKNIVLLIIDIVVDFGYVIRIPFLFHEGGIMHHFFTKGLSIAGIIFITILFQCTNSQWVTDSKTKAEGIAILKIGVIANSPFTRIAKTAVLTISASDMLTMTMPLFITDSSVEGFVKGIPAGKNRLFEVFIYDSLEKLQYKGSATANIAADSTVPVSIAIYRTNGSAIINGTIIEGGTVSDPDSNVLAYWSFDSSSSNTYFDVTGHGFDATSLGLSLVPGIKGKALNCPGGGYELIVKNSKERFNAPKFTIETWFYSNVDIDANDMLCKLFDFQCINSGIYNGYAIHIDAEGKVVFAFADRNVDWVTAISKTTILPKAWYHIVCTYDGMALKEYINGKLDATTNFCGTYSPPGANARIGCQTLTDGTVRYPINGKLDEMKLYNISLTADVVKAHYDALKPQN